MKAIGLQPSSTGMVGGKETGQHMMRLHHPGGPFTRLSPSSPRPAGSSTCKARIGRRQEGAEQQAKFTCPSCDQNAWGKPDLAITCTPCGLDMLAERNRCGCGRAARSHRTIQNIDVAIDPPSGGGSQPKRKRGRPKGSKTKPKEENTSPSYDAKPPRKSRHDKHVNIAAE